MFHIKNCFVNLPQEEFSIILISSGKHNKKPTRRRKQPMKKRFAASAMILAMSAATVLSPLTAFADAEEQELNIAIFQGGYGDTYWNQMVELFEQSHEGIKVNMTISLPSEILSVHRSLPEMHLILSVLTMVVRMV